ncbi:unnamed protein product [Dicrocoelium dendriticum]|nr:unnamed protein product [Dicrocoelium dendriticum]
MTKDSQSGSCRPRGGDYKEVGQIKESQYEELRERNNAAVRKCRAKARAWKMEVIREYKKLQVVNEHFRKHISSGLRELAFLRYLFIRSHKCLPKFMTDLLSAAKPDGQLGKLLAGTNSQNEPLISPFKKRLTNGRKAPYYQNMNV